MRIPPPRLCDYRRIGEETDLRNSITNAARRSGWEGSVGNRSREPAPLLGLPPLPAFSYVSTWAWRHALKQGLDRAKRVIRKRFRILVRYAPYLSGKGGPRILVDELYLSILGQPGDLVARAAAAKALAKGQKRVPQIVDALMAARASATPSHGSLETTATEIYLGVVGRPPSPAELQRAIADLAGGKPLSRIIEQISSSRDARKRIFSRALEDGGFADLILIEASRRRAS